MYAPEVDRTAGVDVAGPVGFVRPQRGEGVGDRVDDPVGGPSGRARRAKGQVGQLHRVAEVHPDRRATDQRADDAAEQTLGGLVGQHLVGSPLGDRHDGRTAGQGETGGAGLAAFGPHARVQADASLRVDQDRRAGGATPISGARNSPPVAMILGATRRARQAAASTIGSNGLMWLAARISGPPRSRAGMSPVTRSRASIPTTRRASSNATRQISGGRQGEWAASISGT